MDTHLLKQSLLSIAEKRGYLLPHHGLLAISGAGLLEGYDALYSAINFSERTLSRHDHEFIWLAVLITCREPIATHHIRRFFDAGGDHQGLANVVSLATFAGNAMTYEFIQEHWSKHLPEFDTGAAYLDGFAHAARETDATLAQLAGLAVHVCTGNSVALRLHLVAASQLGTDDLAIAESFSLAMFPASVPNYARAAETWRQMIVNNELPASALFTEWAHIEGQGGYDEAHARGAKSD